MTQSLGLDPISGPKLLDYWNPFDELKEVEVKEVRTEIFIHRLNLKWYIIPHIPYSVGNKVIHFKWNKGMGKDLSSVGKFGSGNNP